MKTQKIIAIYLIDNNVSCWNITENQTQPLAEAFPEHQIALCNSEDAFMRALPNAEFALTWTFKQEWLELAPNLKIISTPAAGHDYFHIMPPPEMRMMYGQFHGEIMAETAVASILAMTRGILHATTTFKDILWPRHELNGVMRPLRNSTILIAGFGHIGQWCGKLLKPFGTKIVGLRRNISATRPEWMDSNDIVIGENTLENILPQVDHLVMALPSGKETENLMNASRLDLLPKHATITNIGRGNSIDETHIVSMLNAGKLAAACLDVFKNEPLNEESIVRNCKNLWIFPHSSAISPNYLDLYVKDFIRQCKTMA